MTDNKWTRESAPWLALEGLAIVVSILLAFSIDAWWEDRQEQHEVQDFLLEVLEDLRSGKDIVDFFRQMSDAQVNAADKLLQASSEETFNITEDETDRLLMEISFYTDIDLVSEGAINALLSSGKIGVIESTDLRRLISGWPAALAEARYNMQPEYDFQRNIYIPFLIKYGNLTQVLRGLEHIPGHPERTDWQQSVILAGKPVSHSALLADNEFLNILAMSRIHKFNTLYYLNKLGERLDQSIQLVEQELSNLQ